MGEFVAGVALTLFLGFCAYKYLESRKRRATPVEPGSLPIKDEGNVVEP